MMPKLTFTNEDSWKFASSRLHNCNLVREQLFKYEGITYRVVIILKIFSQQPPGLEIGSQGCEKVYNILVPRPICDEDGHLLE